MKKIKLTQGKFALVDDSDFEWLSQWKWCAYKAHNTFYAGRSLIIKKRLPRKTIHMHRVIMKTPKGMDTDHINHNGLDNRRSNLRVCTRSENQLNRSGLQRNNTSGFQGVSWDELSKKWVAQKKINYKRIFLGRFKTKKDAIEAINNFNKTHGKILH